MEAAKVKTFRNSGHVHGPAQAFHRRFAISLNFDGIFENFASEKKAKSSSLSKA
jgi:hypothetical protein